MASSYPNPSGSTPYSPPNSSMALISLISGILGLTFVPIIGSIIAVITGPMAKKEIRESGGAVGGEGLATAGMVLGWIGIGLTVLGLCLGVVIFGGTCLAMLGLSTQGTNLIAPALLTFF